MGEGEQNFTLKLQFSFALSFIFFKCFSVHLKRLNSTTLRIFFFFFGIKRKSLGLIQDLLNHDIGAWLGRARTCSFNKLPTDFHLH